MSPKPVSRKIDGKMLPSLPEGLHWSCSSHLKKGRIWVRRMSVHHDTHSSVAKYPYFSFIEGEGEIRKVNFKRRDTIVATDVPDIWTAVKIMQTLCLLGELSDGT